MRARARANYIIFRHYYFSMRSISVFHYLYRRLPSPSLPLPVLALLHWQIIKKWKSYGSASDENKITIMHTPAQVHTFPYTRIELNMIRTVTYGGGHGEIVAIIHRNLMLYSYLYYYYTNFFFFALLHIAAWFTRNMCKMTWWCRMDFERTGRAGLGWFKTLERNYTVQWSTFFLCRFNVLLFMFFTVSKRIRGRKQNRRWPKHTHSQTLAGWFDLKRIRSAGRKWLERFIVFAKFSVWNLLWKTTIFINTETIKHRLQLSFIHVNVMKANNNAYPILRLQLKK